MQEIVINEVSYQLNFGMGFLREMNKMVTRPVPGFPGKNQEIGFGYYLGNAYDYDLDSIETILITANKGFNPRLTQKILDAYFEDETTDIESVRDMVIDFLSRANVTKKETSDLIQKAEKIKEAQERKEAQEMEANS